MSEQTQPRPNNDTVIRNILQVYQYGNTALGDVDRYKTYVTFRWGLDVKLPCKLHFAP